MIRNIPTIHVDEFRERVRKVYVDKSHWIMAFDAAAAPLVQKIFHKHYRGATLDEFQMTVFGEPRRDAAVFIATMAKSRMSAKQYNRLLQRAGFVFMSNAQLAQRDVLNVASPGLLDAATRLTMFLVNRETDEPATPEENERFWNEVYEMPAPPNPNRDRADRARWN
jgi:hypothetical protein